MPIYLYNCDECDMRHEVRQSFQDKALTKCPVCGYDGIKKVFTTPAVTFNGTGFYSTDKG